MPTLEWIGKDKVINHHNEVPFRILNRKYSYDVSGEHLKDNNSENKIIHGDNLEALKSLLPMYEGKINCIYIDPPYNTGNENWIYNDNVNDPRIKKWLGEIVGKEGEDLSRHDKWLCMMYPRLRLLSKLLSQDGKMVISIGYHELNNLLCICREIFAGRQIVTVTVQTSGGKPSGGFNYVHEYLVYIVPTDFTANSLEFCGGKTRTPFEGLTLSTFNKSQRPNQVYPIFVDTTTDNIVEVGMSLQELINKAMYTGEKSEYEYSCDNIPEGTVAIWPITSKGKECVWRQIPDRLLNDWEKGYIKVSKNRSKNNPNQYSIQYLPEGVIKKIKEGKLKIIGHDNNSPTLIFGENQTVGSQIPTLWSEKEFYTVNGTQLLRDIFSDEDKVFDYPKSLEYIMAVVQSISNEGDIVLDSFAGSGTLGHAVLNLNAIDDKQRKFIMIEMGDYANNVTAERIKRVINGYGDTENKVDGIDGDFSYYELGEQLLLDNGSINESIEETKIREYIWFMEVKRPIKDVESKDNEYYLGTNNDTAYYFYYDKNSITTLDRKFLSKIHIVAEAYIIYADLCAISEKELQKYNIVFKKIPRDITRL